MSNKNPLDFPGTVFDITLANPNPSSSKTKDGPKYRVSFEVEQGDWQRFMDAKTQGMLIAAKACVVGEEGDHLESPERTAKGPYGGYARELKLSGFFRSPAVWRGVGSDDKFREWIQRQPSALSGVYSEYVNGEGRCVAAHVPLHDGSKGIAHKPDYACIPLTDEEHRAQHQQGESVIGDRDWWNRKRLEYVERWAWETTKGCLGYQSWTEVPPESLLKWANKLGVAHYLPKEYRE